MKKIYCKPLTEIETEVLLTIPVLASGDVNGDSFDNSGFDPGGLGDASMIGRNPGLSLQNRAMHLWDENEN